MNNTEKVSNVFFVHSFIAASFTILIFGTFSAINLIRNFGDILGGGGTSDSLTVSIIGIVCIILMPYCFRIVKSLQILEIVGSGSNKQKLLLHPPIFVNDMNLPDEIELSQISYISQDKIFSNLVEFSIVENGDEKKIYSFIEKGKLDVIYKLLRQKRAQL